MQTPAPAREAAAPALFVTQLGEQTDAARIQQVSQQAGPQLPSRLRDRTEDTYEFSTATELPGAERLFRRESENEFLMRLRQEYKTTQPGGGAVFFPETEPLTREPFRPRQFPGLVRGVEPHYVCHGRLLFEQKNFERQGWDLGILTPVANLGIYYYDLALLPYHAFTRPTQLTDCSSGKCLPGDPTPLYFYHEEFSVSGLVGQAAVVTGLFYLFP
jgi:hypothetical protein